MAYTRTTWVESETALSPANMNNIEDGIEEALAKVGGNAEMWSYISNLVYPVGAIYMSASPTDPATLFGGVWVPWGSGRVPVGIDTEQEEFNLVEKTGGSVTHSHTNPSTGSTVLTEAQIPSHSHAVGGRVGVRDYGGESAITTVGSLRTGTTGGGQGHDHTMGNTGTESSLQPYITCYMWKRQA